MSESRAQTVTDVFVDYACDRTERLTQLSVVLGAALPILEHLYDPNGANARLLEVNRADLIVTEPAAMMPTTTPHEVLERCNNFQPHFHMYTGRRETGELDMHDEPRTEPIAPTAEEILTLRTLPKITSYEEAISLEESGEYPALGHHSHATKPAFLRMLHLFPEFTAMIVTEMSAPENRYEYSYFEAELFVAYQIMARLVDQSDQYVTKDGEVDDWYLCR